ncbi:MAG TPA: S53 family peptidase [Terriglobales bacterium]|nr:S53 family peptidase [Terriglobales bacterium]
MRHSVALLTIAAAILFLMLASSASVAFAQVQPQSLFTGHVRDVTLNGEAPSVGRLPATHSMQIDVVLPMRDQAGLDSFLRELYNPSSPSYRHFLSVEQFTETFGPSQEDYDAVIRFAKANSFTVVGGSRDAMDVQLKGSVAVVETAFHITMGIYHDPIRNRDFYAPDREPTVDLPFRLWHISGLDNYSIPRPELLRRPPSVKPPATTGSCPQQSFCGSDMRAAYYEGAALTGKGQNIGLLEFAGFDIADVNTYYKNAKQKRTAAVKGISTDGTPLSCFYPACDDSEQTLDITQALGMAPGVTTVYLYVGSSDTAILGSMSSHKPLPLQLSASWNWSSSPATDDPYFKKMAAQGQSFFKGAGDGGAWGNDNCGGEWPRDDAYITSVGGTDLTTKGPGKGWASETGWSDGGGGYCPVDGIKIPSWQKLKGVITKANQGSKTYRNGPDVSAEANFDFYLCADQSGCTANEYGGVSFATPMWAGYLALANQQAAVKKLPPPGFINPTIYPLGLGKGYHTDFHDITSGGNGNPPTKGYDLTSGWGSPKTDGLINALAK